MQPAKRYRPALVTMHWLIALMVFINLYLGIVVFENRGEGPGNFQGISSLVTVHMAVGVTIILLLMELTLSQKVVQGPDSRVDLVAPAAALAF